MPLPDRLHVVARRLEAGIRETPQRFAPLAFHIAGLDRSTQCRFLHFLVEEVQRQAAQSGGSDIAQALLARSVNQLSTPDEHRTELVDDILAAEEPRRRRRHVHCHGRITSDRYLLFLRSLMPDEEVDAYHPIILGRTISYAMSDYHYDHFVMIGAHLAPRVRALADWVERELSGHAAEGVAG